MKRMTSNIQIFSIESKYIKTKIENLKNVKYIFV